VGLGIAVALGLFVVCGSASAGTLADFADTDISALNPVVNFGSSTDILVGNGAEALVQFNLSSLGVSSVSSASLLLRYFDGHLAVERVVRNLQHAPNGGGPVPSERCGDRLGPIRELRRDLGGERPARFSRH